MRIESNHKLVADAQERKRIISQEYEDFMEDYKCIVYGRPSPDLQVFEDNRSVLDESQKRTCQESTYINENHIRKPLIVLQLRYENIHGYNKRTAPWRRSLFIVN
jgi:hypothetical protein